MIDKMQEPAVHGPYIFSHVLARHVAIDVCGAVTPRYLTGVITGNLSGARGGAASEDRTALADVDDGGSRNRGRAARESDGVEVNKVDQRATRRKVLDNPLCIVLAERIRLGREGVRDGLSGGLVLEGDRTGLQCAGSGSHDNRVTSRD